MWILRDQEAAADGVSCVIYYDSRQQLMITLQTPTMVQLLYQDSGYRRPVSWWNAADTMGNDGMLQHGTAVALEPDGVIVDFGCAGQRRQSVKYGEAFSYWEQYCSEDELPPGRVVEVLLHQDAQNPWVWRPATLVTAYIPDELSCGSLALVDVQLRGVGRREVVSYKQIRPPPIPKALRLRAIQKNDFVATSVCPLPAEIADLLPTHSPLWKVLCQQLSLRCVSPISVSNSELVFLQRTEPSYVRDQSELVALIQQARESIDASIKTGITLVEEGYRCGFPLACDVTEVEEIVEGNGWILQDVHHHVLEEMFTYLDTMQRSSMRRVCRIFDELISDTLSAEIRVTYSKCSLGGRASCSSCSQLCEYYPLQAPLLKCVTARTRRITVTNGGTGTLSDFLLTLRICGQLGQCVADQQVVGVAVQCDLEVQDMSPWGNSVQGFWGHAGSLAESMAGGCCKQLILMQCSMSTSLPGVRFTGSLYAGAVQEDLGRLIEGQLPGFDIQRTAEWVAEAVRGQCPDCSHICQSLNEFTTPDSQVTNAYAGYRWTEENLASVNVGKLSRLAQYALNRHVPLLKSF